VDGALGVADGQEVTMAAPARNSTGYQQLLTTVEAANPGRGHRGDHRQPLQPHQLLDSYLAG
jgi:hypothetical protein